MVMDLTAMIAFQGGDGMKKKEQTNTKKLTRAELDEAEKYLTNPFGYQKMPSVMTGLCLRLIARVRAQDEALREIEEELVRGTLGPTTVYRLARIARAARMGE